MRRILAIWFLLLPVLGFGQAVPQSFFAMDLNTTSNAAPNIPLALTPSAPFGVIRDHDNSADMADIFGMSSTSTCNTATHVHTTCNWTAFDHWIAQAAAHNQTVMYTLHKTPNFAGTYTSSPPDDASLTDMIDAIRDRAGCTATVQVGCIKYWEVWNEPNNDGGTLSTTSSGSPYWSGSIENLVHVARIIHDEVKTVANGGVNGVDPNAMVIGPGVADFGVYTNMPGGTITLSGVCSHWSGGGGVAEPEAFICEYLRRTGSGSGDLTGADYTDAVSSHLYPNVVNLTSMSEDPVNIRGGGIVTAITDNGLSLCAHGVQGAAGGSCINYFATEDSWGAQSSGTYPNIGPVSPSVQVSGTGQTGSWRDDQSAFLIKAHVMAWNLGLDMYTWYGWDFQNGWGNLFCTSANTNNGCVLDVNNPSFPYRQNAANAYGALQKWMIGKTLSSCSKDGNATWTCSWTGSGGYTSKLVWNSPQTGVSLSFSGYSQQRDMYGNITSFSGTITPGYYPVLLEHLAVVRRANSGGWN
jgi:hypothetical protein